MKTRNIIAALAAAAAMTVSAMSLPVLAEGEIPTSFTLTFKNPAADNDLADHTYEAFQIFTGDLYATGTQTLSNIQWGDGVDSAALITALKAASNSADFKAVFGTLKDTDTAETVARLLEENTNLAEEFADVLNKTGVLTATKTTSASDKITVDEAGYYLIRDVLDPVTAAGEGKQYAVTDYILKVTDDATIAITQKEDVPTLEKQIKEGADLVSANTAAIGDRISYQVDSAVPDMSGYTAYYYIVTDTLSAGLTFNEDVAVKIGGTALEPDQFTVKYDAATDAQHFEIAIIDFYDSYKEQAGDAIEITYSATLNQDAEVGTVPNTNTANLKFSNNPNITPAKDEDEDGFPDSGEPGGETPDSVTKTYTTEITIIKEDASTHAPLQGAKFELTGEGIKALLINGEVFVEDENGTYYLLKDGTFTENAPHGAEDTDTEEYNAKYDDITKKYSKVEKVTKDTETTNVCKIGYTNDEGKLTFTGLDAGSYTLSEIEAPKNYNKIADDISFEITGTINADSSVSWSIDNTKFSENTRIEGETEVGIGTFSITVGNSKGIILPGTGGVGTLIFYVAGTLMIGTAVALVVTKKRMSIKEK